jgi:hypothetical protein
VSGAAHGTAYGAAESTIRAVATPTLVNSANPRLRLSPSMRGGHVGPMDRAERPEIVCDRHRVAPGRSRGSNPRCKRYRLGAKVIKPADRVRSASDPRRGAGRPREGVMRIWVVYGTVLEAPPARARSSGVSGCRVYPSFCSIAVLSSRSTSTSPRHLTRGGCEPSEAVARGARAGRQTQFAITRARAARLGLARQPQSGQELLCSRQRRTRIRI